MENNNQVFEYTYSAKRQEEIQKIKEKYMAPEEDKMEQLRKLDKAVTRPGTIASLVIGIIGTLIMGVGMCMCLIPDWADKLFGLGIAIGIVGIAILAAAYPVYLRLTAKQKEKLAPQILKLAEELSE